MKKEKKKSRFSSEKLAFAGGVLGGFMNRAQSMAVNLDHIPELKHLGPMKIRVPKGKAGIALAAGSLGLSAASFIQTFRESEGVGETLTKLFLTNPLSRSAGHLGGHALGAGGLKAAEKLKKLSSAYAAKKAAPKMKDVTPNNVVFRRIAGRIVPIRKK